MLVPSVNPPLPLFLVFTRIFSSCYFWFTAVPLLGGGLLLHLLDLSEELLEACGESVSRLRRARLQDDGAAALAGQVELRLQLLRRHRCDQVLLVCEEQHHCAIERVLVQQHRLRRIVIQYANEEEFAGQKDLEQVEEEQRIRGLFLAGMVLECEVSEGVLGSDSG